MASLHCLLRDKLQEGPLGPEVIWHGLAWKVLGHCNSNWDVCEVELRRRCQWLEAARALSSQTATWSNAEPRHMSRRQKWRQSDLKTVMTSSKLTATTHYNILCPAHPLLFHAAEPHTSSPDMSSTEFCTSICVGKVLHIP
jgi:hypothetical protein